MRNEPMIEALKTALEALDSDNPDIQLRAAIILRQAIVEAEKQDGYCQACDGDSCTARRGCVALSNPPPQRQWVGLTDEEVFDVWLNEMPAPDKVFYQKLCRSVEAKLREKNT